MTTLYLNRKTRLIIAGACAAAIYFALGHPLEVKS